MKSKLLLTLSIVLLFVACKKADSTPSSSTLPINTIEFYIDGVKQTYTNAFATHGAATLGTGYILSVSSIQMSPTIQVKAFDSVLITSKTYYASSTSNAYSYTLYGAWETSSANPNGYVKITSISSTNVQGEFMDSVYKFSTNNWKVLRQGKFNVNF